MFGFGLNNIRRISSDKIFDLKKINIIVGKNSSGKSTFLRSLPLLKQSIDTRTNAPILWYGDLVDFGSFTNSVCNNDDTQPITFSFRITDFDIFNNVYPALNYNEFRALSYLDKVLPDEKSGFFRKNKIEIIVNVIKFGEKTRVKEITLNDDLNSNKFVVSFDEDMKLSKFILNDEDVTNLSSQMNLCISNDSIFPNIRESIVTSIDAQKKQISSNFISNKDNSSINIKKEILSILSRRMDGRFSIEKKSELVDILCNIPCFNKDIVKYLRGLDGSVSWKKLILDLSDQDIHGDFYKIKRLVSIFSFPSLFNRASTSMSNQIVSILYIGPARVRSDRYYRKQDLSVSEIDPNGSNLPMFLSSLTKEQNDSFSDWVENLFGYRIKIQRSAGHISINLRINDKDVNVVDTGYGVSQILPVLAQIWWASTRKINKSKFRSDPINTILCIEQPELHLHPAHQALLANAFVKGLSSEGDNKNPCNYVIETHSEALINKLGRIIYDEGKKENPTITKNDVQILIFDRDDENNDLTKIKTSSYDENGYLIDWPFDFFVA